MPRVPEQPVVELRGLVALGRGDPGDMRRQEALVVTAGTAVEAGRDGEQPRPAGLGCRARVEPGGPQESRQQCEFRSSVSDHGGGTSDKTGDPRVELTGALKVYGGGLESR